MRASGAAGVCGVLPRRAALFSRRRLARQQRGFEQLVAWLLLIISFVGSLLLGGGGVAAWVAWKPNLWLAGAALALQAVLTYVQCIYAERGWRAWQYLAAVLVSSALTAGGYWQLVHPWGVGLLAGWQVPAANAPYLAGGLIALVALLIDHLPPADADGVRRLVWAGSPTPPTSSSARS